ncbi:MAG TPA: hypothetical protein VFG23_25550 [Polyangia bacterium]|nr:hypothetical protein [Polyangia bacterium]
MANKLRRIEQPTSGYVLMTKTGLIFNVDPVTAGVLAKQEETVTGMLSEHLAKYLAEHSIPAEPDVVFDYMIEGPFVASGALSTGAVSIWFKPKG